MSLDQSINEQEKMLDRKILVQEAYKYLTEGIYPAAASSNEKRVIMKKFKTFSLHHGELFYKRTNRGRRGSKVNIYIYIYILNVYKSPCMSVLIYGSKVKTINKCVLYSVIYNQFLWLYIGNKIMCIIIL